MDTVEPKVGDGLSSRSLAVQSRSTGLGVVAGELYSERPNLSGPADNEIVSAIHL